MRRSLLRATWVAALALLWTGTALAQPPAQPPALAQPPTQTAAPQALQGLDNNIQQRLQRIDQNHWRLVGDVEVTKDNVKISADEMDVFTDRDLLTAKGNATLTTETESVSADSLEFNTKTKLGVFHHASGSAQIEEDQRKRKNQFGTQETQILFYGEEIEKIGYRKFKITNGGFTTCVQPKPRWMMTSSTVILNVNHYAMLRNALIKVKGVPVLYLPVVYYPINKEDRATGFLMPMYGSSTLKGQTLSNAFFWALSRNQDATFMYDWYSKAGHGFGTEYRYVGTGGNNANGRFYQLSQPPITYTDPVSGSPVSVAGQQSLDMHGSATQNLPFHLRARGRIDYFSSISVQQTFNTNIYDTSQRQRYFGGTVTGNWGAWGMATTLEKNEYFFNTTQSTVAGSLPRVSFSRNEKPLFSTPLYFSLGTEFASIVRQTITENADQTHTTIDTGLNRVDFSPRIRYPFTKWPFFTVNSSLGWRFTWWNQSLDPTLGQVATSVDRTYFDLSAQIVGPVFNKIWDMPKSGFAEKIKHTIEPWVNIERITAINNFSKIVQLDSTDAIVGSTTQISFGLNNRIYAKRKVAGAAPGAVAQSRQIFSFSLRQTYYTDALASQYDPGYASSFGAAAPKKMSPISVSATAAPTDSLNATFRTEYNTYFKAFLTFGAQGSYKIGDWLTTSAGWSQRRFVNGLGGYELSNASQFLNSDSTLHFLNNKVGGTVSFNWDIHNNLFLQDRFIGYYNAQCCGVIVEYQTYNFAGITYAGGVAPPVTKDHRFNIAITLAGIGTFSPFFGALGGGGTSGMR